MNFNQLSFVVALERHRHFGEAANACFVTQPALSMQLQKLERELGVQLFDRTRTPIEPTDVGVLVIEQARRVLDEVTRLRELARDSGAEVAGDLRVGVIPTLGPYLLPSVLPGLVNRHPRLRLWVEELQTEEVLAGIRRGDLDAGLIATASAQRGIEETPLFTEPFAAYVAQEHSLFRSKKVRVEELDLQDVWLLTQGHCFRDQVLPLCADRAREQIDRPPPLRFESGNLETLKRLVDHNGGLTLLPQLAVASLAPEERRRVRYFLDPVPAREVRLVRGMALLKRAPLNALVDELVTFARNAGLVTSGGLEAARNQVPGQPRS